MASLTANRNVLANIDQENPTKSTNPGAIIKKRSAVPVTRSALGNLSSNVATQRPVQKGVAPLKQERKPTLTRQRTTVNLKSKNAQAAIVKKPLKLQQVKDAAKSELVSPTPMEMGTPLGKVEEKNVFDRTSKPDVDDIDVNDSDNPQLCSEFVNEIYHYMLFLEAEYPIKKHYLKETTLKSRMRSILVDWLFQVHHRFQLLQETLYLTIAILDRFLQIHPVPRTKLQLAGVTAMLLASKYEEMYAPEVSDFVYITDKAFSRSQILQMETLMLKTLDFNLGRPLPLHFLRRNSKAGQVDATQHTFAKYMMELSLVDYEMCHVAPSKLAAAALCLSTKLLDNCEWTPTLEHYSTYSNKELAPIVCHLAKNLKAAESSTYLQAIKSKYSSAKCSKISQIAEIKSPVVVDLAEKAASIVL